jgi:PleD family two-component response regulator
VPVTASIGIAGFRSGESLDALVDRADRAIYLAKSSGRNRVARAPDLDAAGDVAVNLGLQLDRQA